MPNNFDDDDFDRDDRPRRNRDDRTRDRDRYEDEGSFDPPPKKKNPLPLILGIVGLVLMLFCGGVGLAVYLLISPVIQKARVTAARIETQNNMRSVDMGALNYESANGEWVHNRWNNTNTLTLLSWRYELFPFLEQDGLYNSANRNKPWDDPSNATVLNTSLKIFKHNTDSVASNQTYFQSFSGQGAILDPKSPRKGRLGGQQQPLSIGNIRDGATNTIFFVEASTKVNIIQPVDIPFPSATMPTLGVDQQSKTFLGAFCDGSVRQLRRTSATQQGLTSWVCPNDGGIAPFD